MNTQIKEAIDRAGGVMAVASHFGIRPVSVYEWIRRGSVPADKCPEIEKFSGGVARCEDLNHQVDWAYVRASQPIATEARRATDPEPPPGRAGRTPVSVERMMTVATDQPVLYERRPPANPK